MFSDDLMEMAERSSNRASDKFQKALEFKREQNSIDALYKLAQMRESGYEPVQNQSGGIFGGGGYNGIRPIEEKPLPAGFVKVGGKVMQDPSFQTEKEKAMTEYYKRGGAYGGSSIFGGGVTPDGDPIPAQLIGDEYLATLNPQIKELVKGVTDYSIDPTKTSSIRGNQRQQLINAAKLYDPTYDMTQFPRRSATGTEYSKGMTGRNIKSFNTAIKHLSTLNDAIGQAPNPRIFGMSASPYTAAVRAGTKAFGSDTPEGLGMSAENSAINAVAGELATAFKGGSAGDQIEYENWLKAYNPNLSPEAKRQFIKTGVELLQGRINALSSDYERVMGKKPESPLLYPETQTIIDKLTGGISVPEWAKGDPEAYQRGINAGGSDEEIQSIFRKRGLIQET
jgi:hypothetical protein